MKTRPISLRHMKTWESRKNLCLLTPLWSILRVRTYEGSILNAETEQFSLITILKFCMLSTALIQAVFHIAFGRKKIGAQKIKKQFFSKISSILWKAHAHYFTFLIYLATWRAAKLGIFTHFLFTNLPRCSQSITTNICVLYADPQVLFMSAWPQSWSYLLFFSNLFIVDKYIQ